jgi:transposase
MSKRKCKIVKKVSGLLKKLNCREFLHHFGPKKYKFKQHAAALLLKEVCKTSFRRVVILFDLFDVAVPTYSALCKSRKRIPNWIWANLLTITAGLKHDIAAVDSSGFNRTNPSYHYIKRIDRRDPVKGFAKTSMLYGIKGRKIISVNVRVKPSHDLMDVKKLLKGNRIDCLLADKAYDAEWLHEYCFDKGIATVIPKRKNVRRGFYRRKQMKNYSDKKYHQRSLVESGFSAVKRRYGSSVSGKRLASIRAEIYCKALAYNMRLMQLEIFN